MLHRSSSEGLICITQPNHAWVSGQLAQAWGNEEFGRVAPTQEVYLGAEQHDIGWLSWEEAPTLNPQTGYPYHFAELPTRVHVGIWSGSRQLARPLGRYVSLLVSLHGTRLYERHRSWQNSPESAPIVQNFLNCEYTFQEKLISALQNDPYYAPYITRAAIDRNKQLVATWDALSLLLCQGFSGEPEVERVPAADGETVLKLTRAEDNPHQVNIAPWPFRENEVTLVYEGWLLRQTFTDETAMQQALRDRGVTLRTILNPSIFRKNI